MFFDFPSLTAPSQSVPDDIITVRELCISLIDDKCRQLGDVCKTDFSFDFYQTTHKR